MLAATRLLVPRKSRSGRESDSEIEDIEHAENFRHIEALLEEGGHFLGIYRKVQLKPSKWVKLPKPNADCEDERPVEALMVLKYGGVLPLVGRKQAEKLGRFFWNNMYLDEGRVKMSAAAFAKDFLDLERQLTPILVSLVSKDSLMLDGLEDASEMEEAKAKLHEIVTSEEKTLNGNMSGGPSWMVDGAGVPDNASQLLRSLINLTKKITAKVKAI